MEPYTEVAGGMGSNMEKVMKYGSMGQNTLVSISKAKKRVVEFIYGTMGLNTSVSGIMM